MARFTRLKVLNTMIGTGLVPVFYHPKLEVAKEVAAACMAGGCQLLEFTNRGDHAWEVFNELEKYCAKELPEMILGVGSVVDPGTASLYINCGANFVVGPVLNPMWRARATGARFHTRRDAAARRKSRRRRNWAARS